MHYRSKQVVRTPLCYCAQCHFQVRVSCVRRSYVNAPAVDIVKAGCVLYTKSNKVIIIQSHGYKWGFPKGKFEDTVDNTLEDCALREVFEETGLRIYKSQLQFPFRVQNYIFYFVEIDEPILDIHSLDAEITGCVVIRYKCLKLMIEENFIDMNHYSRLALSEYSRLCSAQKLKTEG